MNILKVKRIGNHQLPVPAYKTTGAACFDLSIASGRASDGVGVYGTGFAFEIPEGHVMLVYIRSSVGCMKDAQLMNNVGVIDSDYRGEVTLHVKFNSDEWYPKVGERIAQAMIIPVDQYNVVEVDELTETDRGTGGHGSTGAN